MSASIGVNVSKDGLVTVESLQWLGARWVRLVADRDWQDVQVQYCRDLHAAGIRVFLTFDADSYRRFGDPSDPATWTAAAQWGRATYSGLIDALCPTNEPDGTGAESSAMPVATVNGMIRAHREAWPRGTVQLVAAGTVSGQPSYYDDLDLGLLDGIDFHPYAQWDAESLTAMIDRHAAIGLPLWISEVGLDASDEHQAEFLTWTLETIRARSDVVACMWFCAQPYGPWGLIRDDGTWRPAAEAFRRVAAGAVEPPPPPALVYAIDVSSHQGRDLTEIIREHDPLHVIVKMYLPIESISQDHTREQWRSAMANGCTVGGYVWCYRSANPRTTIDQALDLAESAGVTIPCLWLDCETYGDPVSDPGPDAVWLRAALDQCRRRNQRVGIYTGRWWVREWFPGGEAAFSEFNHLPLWLALHDDQPNLAVWEPFSGFTQLAAKQWSVWKGPTYELDRDVIRPEFTVSDGGGGQEDELARLRATVEGLRVALDDVVHARMGERLSALRAEVNELQVAHAEARRIRVQFLGED